MLYYFLFFFINLSVCQELANFLNQSYCDCQLAKKIDLENYSFLPPWQVTLKVNSPFYQSEYMCSAIIVNKLHLISAASCFNGIEIEKEKPNITLFRKKKISDSLHKSKIKIIKVYYENDYSEQEFDSDHYLKGLILIEIEKPIVFNSKLKPACFVDANSNRFYTKHELLMGSWGILQQTLIDENYNFLEPKQITEYFSSEFTYIKYNTTIISYSNNAQEDVAYDFCLKKEVLCATPKRYSACFGSEGSPLYYKTNDRYYVVAMNILNYPLFVNKTLTGIPVYGQCLRNEFDMFLRTDKVFKILKKKLNTDQYCVLKFPQTSDFKKSVFERASTVSKICECSFDKSKQLATNLSLLEKEKTIFIESDKFGWIVQLITLRNNQYIFACTGVIVNSYYVLTTAICLFNYGQDGIYLYLKKDVFTERSALNHEEYIRTKKFKFKYEYNIYHDDSDNVGIIELMEEIDFQLFNHLKPACFPRKDDEDDYFSDYLFTLSWQMSVYNTNYPETENKTFLYTAHFEIQEQDYINNKINCDSKEQICIVTNTTLKFSYTGSVLHRLIRKSMQVIGLFCQSHIINNDKLSLHYNVFVDLRPSFEWIQNFLNGPYEYCQIDETNKKINKSDCICEFSLKDIGKTMPWYVTILKVSFGDEKKIIIPICRGIILNDYWILSTAICINDNQNNDLYISIKNEDSENIYFFEHKISLGEVIKIDYTVYNSKLDKKAVQNNIALLKLKKKIIKKNVDFSLACLLKEVNKTDLDEDLILTQINNKLVSLSFKSFNDSLCKEKENLCFIGDEEIVCNYDVGSPVINVINKKSYVIGFLSESINSICTKKKHYLVKKLTYSFSWINSIIGELSYCTESSPKIFQGKNNLCFCSNANNDALIAYRFSDLALTVACSGVILSEYFIATSITCISQYFHIEDYFIVLDLNFISEEKIIISELSIKPYHISHIFNDNGSIILLKTEERLNLGSSTNFFPACLSKNKGFNKSESASFLKIRSQNIISSIVVGEKTQNCDDVNVFCLKTKEITCASDNGVSIKQFTIDKDTEIKRFYTIGLFETSFTVEKIGKLHRLYFDENWITKKIGLGRMCSFEKEEEKLMPCSCEYRGGLRSRLFNGTEVTPKSVFSFMAHVVFFQDKIEDNNKDSSIRVNLVCGAVILHYDWVLTSKNAMKSYYKNEQRAKMFVAFSNNFSEDSKFYILKSNLMNIVDVIYYDEEQVDLALIKVSPEFKIGDETRLYAPCIAKHKYENFDETMLFVLGFGYSKTIEQKRKQISVDFKMIKYTTYTDQQIMRKKYPTLCDATRYCLPGDLGSVCVGDAGGPLLEIRNNVIELVGIVYANDTYKWAYDSDQVLCKPSEISVFTLIDSKKISWMSESTKVKDFCEFSA